MYTPEGWTALQFGDAGAPGTQTRTVLMFKLELLAVTDESIDRPNSGTVRVRVTPEGEHAVPVVAMIPTAHLTTAWELCKYICGTGALLYVAHPAGAKLFPVLMKTLRRTTNAQMKRVVPTLGRHFRPDGTAEWVWADGSIHETPGGGLEWLAPDNAHFLYIATHGEGASVSPIPRPPPTWAAAPLGPDALAALGAHMRALQAFAGHENRFVPFLLLAHTLLCLRFEDLFREKHRIPILSLEADGDVGKSTLTEAVFALVEGAAPISASNTATESGFFQMLHQARSLPMVWNDLNAPPMYLKTVYDGQTRITRAGAQEVHTGLTISLNPKCGVVVVDPNVASRMVRVAMDGKAGDVALAGHYRALVESCATAHALFPVVWALAQELVVAAPQVVEGGDATLAVRTQLALGELATLADTLLVRLGIDRTGLRANLEARVVTQSQHVTHEGARLLADAIERDRNPDGHPAADFTWCVYVESRGVGTQVAIYPPHWERENRAKVKDFLQKQCGVGKPQGTHCIDKDRRSLTRMMYRVDWEVLWGALLKNRVVERADPPEPLAEGAAGPAPNPDRPAFAFEEFAPPTVAPAGLVTLNGVLSARAAGFKRTSPDPQ